MSNGQYPSAPKDLWPLVSWQTQAPVIGTEQFWQPGAVGEILQETRHRGHEGELCCIVGLPPVGLQPGLPFVLTAVAPKKKKKMFVSLAALSLLAGVLAGCPSSASCVRVRSQLTSDRAHLSVQQAINV